MVKKATLCTIFKNDELLLKMALNGPSKGKWNGIGGWLEPTDATFEDGMKREIDEETKSRVKNLYYHGDMRVFFDGAITEPGVVVYLFSADLYPGDIPTASSEGELKWVNKSNIPYDEMLEDNKYWIPLVLERKRFDIDLYVQKEGHVLMSHTIKTY